jgi:CHAT domain-containing protein
VRHWTQFGLYAVLATATIGAQEPRRSTSVPRASTVLANPDSLLVDYRHALARSRAANDSRGEAASLAAIARVYHRGLAKPDLERALAYYDSAASARAAVAAAFRDLRDTASTDISESEVHFFDEWALAELAADGPVPEQTSALAALAILERGRSHRLLGTRNPEQGVLGLARIQGDLAEDGKTLIFWVSSFRNVASTLVYLVAEDTLVTWLVRPSGNVWVSRRAIVRDSIERYAAALRSGLGVQKIDTTRHGSSTRSGVIAVDPDSGDWHAAAERLREFLLPPDLVSLLPTGGELVLVPDGALHLVPFSLLATGPTGPMLSERYSIRYAPSLSALGMLERGQTMPFVNRAAAASDTGLIRYGWKTLADSMLRVRDSWLSRALVMGNPRMPVARDPENRLLELTALPGAEAEARSVATVLHAPLRIGAQASEAEARRQLPRATIVHFATHGYAYQSREHVGDSFVALAAGDNEDGLLTVTELLNKVPPLSADIVVLSACQTGVGSLQEGEGTVGLQYAFLAKGARSVLVSLWSVNDQATALLMRQFYKHWLEDIDGPNKAEALRRAESDVRKTPGFEHPRYWAAFLLSGAQ